MAEFSDQKISFKIRNHVNFTSTRAVIEPCCVVSRELYIYSFVPAFMRIIYFDFHEFCVLLFVLFFSLETLFQSIALPVTIDDVGLMGQAVQ